VKREEAISVLKELLDNCLGLNGRSLEIVPSNDITSIDQGYEITIKGTLDEHTKQRVVEIVTLHRLAYQTGSFWKTKHSLNKTEPDTFIIYQPQTQKPQNKVK
jgi:hypothetical protein